MSVHVKICGLTTLPDALAAWQAGADLLGFIFVKQSPRYVPPDVAAEMVRGLREASCGSPTVGVFANRPMAKVRRTAELVGLDLVQLHGNETPAQVAELRHPLIVARRVSGAVPWDQLAMYDAWAYLLDSHVPGKLGGTGQAWEYGLATEGRPPEARLILAGGLDPGNVADAVRAVRPWGIDVASGVEASPGRKDVHKMRAFVRQAKGA
jgi:phosphoribosylanthranilate isomerase